MLEFEYVNGPAHALAMQKFLQPELPPVVLVAHRKNFAAWVVALSAGVYLAYDGGHLIFLGAFVGGLIGLIYDIVTRKKRYWATMKASLQPIPVRSIRLRVMEDGLHETMSGIESIAPWSAITSFTIFQRVMYVELASGQYAMIPTDSLSQSSSSIESLAAVLREWGIAEKTMGGESSIDAPRKKNHE